MFCQTSMISFHSILFLKKNIIANDNLYFLLKFIFWNKKVYRNYLRLNLIELLKRLEILINV